MLKKEVLNRCFLQLSVTLFENNCYFLPTLPLPCSFLLFPLEASDGCKAAAYLFFLLTIKIAIQKFRRREKKNSDGVLRQRKKKSVVEIKVIVI